MNTNPLKLGLMTTHSVGIGPVTGRMVRERAVELAIIHGRSAGDPSVLDREEAKRELTGDPESEPNESALESAPESERWDPLPGSPGHKAPTSPSEDEDEEGRSDNERMVTEGVAEADLEQRYEAESVLG